MILSLVNPLSSKAKPMAMLLLFSVNEQINCSKTSTKLSSEKVGLYEPKFRMLCE